MLRKRNASAACCQATTDLPSERKRFRPTHGYLQLTFHGIQCSINHVCGTALSDQEKILEQLKSTDKSRCSVNRFTASLKCLNHHSKTDGQHKMKRLKRRKERNQMRCGGKEASKSKSCHHHSRRQTSNDLAHFHNCCHSSCHCPSSRDALIPNVVPVAQEPSIITDSRLIGHQGLFNHEVKSIDIERLLSKQKKLERCRQQVPEMGNTTSHQSLISTSASTFSTNDLLGADTDEVMPFEKNADPATAHDDCREREKEISQGSDLTPGQRPQQQPDLLSGSVKSILSSQHSSLDVVIIKSSKTIPVMSEKGRTTTQKKQESPVHQTQARGLSPSPLYLSSSHTGDSFDTQHRRQVPDCVLKSVSAVAAGLCDSLRFPRLGRRSLVAESREVLLKALQERHGPQLEENLREVQQGLSVGTAPAKEVQDQEPTMVDEDELLPLDSFTALFHTNTKRQPCFGTQKTTSLQLTRSRHFNWKSSPQLHHNPKQTAEWLTSPVETPVSRLDDILRPTTYQLCMDFEPSGVRASDHLFAPSPTSCWREKASTSQYLEDRFNRPESREAVMFGSFESSRMNHTRAVTESHSDCNIQPFFSYQAQLPDRHSAGSMPFPQELDRFETDRYSFAPSLSDQIHHCQWSNRFQPFSQFSHPSTHPPLRYHHPDMMRYPPSYMLERHPAPPRSSFPSPEHWSFPPMRLY